ncbi:T41AA-like protein [Mya arenaria]|uniref:T41AA-like protein n=1 Tax=Mya arenaria TaxID=6604 RepID=A0ABY7ELC1_MYAAR|nr:transmembrane protein 41A-A-like [Mya arenaria]WAR09601.1 T41AA-like protein [Mya arenaria]
MASILWIPVIFSLSCLLMYTLSVNLPEHTGADRSALKFPRNLDELKALAVLLDDYHDDNMGYVLLLYSCAYLFKQTFAIPGSFFMNLLGGAIFGLWKSFPLACLLSAAGASCCFLLSKHFGKTYVIKYFPNKVEFMQKKVSDNSDSLLFFLLFLRFFPMTPNWFLNMVSPILDIPLHLFFISVFIGLMPYNFICVQTGSMLSDLTSTDNIFTLATSLKLLGIALVALLPGIVINRLKQGRLKTD